jgi:hypothetical protein
VEVAVEQSLTLIRHKPPAVGYHVGVRENAAAADALR